jgi:hypothetical protein
VEAPAVDDETCVMCHAYEATLQALAKDQEVEEELSEGEG